MSSAERLTEYKAVFRWTLSLGVVVVAVADDVGLEMETEETEESRGVSVTPATPTRVKAVKGAGVGAVMGAGVGAGVGTFEGAGGIDCETEAKPEREGVEGVKGEGGATGFDDADVPTLAKAEAEVQVVVFVVVVVADADELSAKVVAGVNAGSGVVTFAGDAPALRVEGWGSGWCWCWCWGFEVRPRPRGVESFCLFSLSLLPTDLAR